MQITHIETSNKDYFFAGLPETSKQSNSGSVENYKKNWPQYIVELDNVYIVEGGAILDENFTYIKECNYQYAFWNNLHNLKEISELLTPKGYLSLGIDFGKTSPKNMNSTRFKPSKIMTTEGERPITKSLPKGVNYLYGLQYFGWYPFGHFHDSLQRLKKLEDLNIESPNLLLSRKRGVIDFDLHLSLFGFNDLNTTELQHTYRTTGEDACIFVPKLFYSSQVAYFSQFSLSGLQYINQKYSALDTPSSPKPTKLYLNRENLGKKRGVTNNEEVEKFLKGEGFTIVDGSEPFIRQLELFRNSEIIIYPHGSMFKNAIFSQKSPRVLEFCPEKRKDYSFYNLGQLMNLDYTFLDTPCDDEFNIEIDINILKEFTKEIRK